MSQRNGSRLNLAEMEDVTDIPIVPLTQRAPEEQPSNQTHEIVRPMKTHKLQSVAVSGALKQLAEQKYKPKAEKIPHLIRFEPWLDELVRRQVLSLQMEGHRKLTKEALVTLAVMRLLGVTGPPED